jgi:tetratricopeptide (TPR) repeat protein
MSSRPARKNLIADFGPEPGALNSLLWRVPAWRNDGEKREFLNLHVQMKQLQAKVSQSLSQPDEAQTEEVLRVSQLQKEIGAYVENLKQSSMSFFRQGRYQDCYEILALLVEMEPDNKAAQEFLEICRQKIVERQDRYHASATDGSLEEATADEMPPWLLESAESYTPDGEARSGKHWLILAFVGLLLAGVLAGMRTRPKSQPISAAPLEIQSEPDSASVFMNGILIGKTPLHLKAVEAGNYGVRFEREGYAPVVHRLVIEKGQSSALSVRLEKLETDPNSLVGLREKAQALFELGNLPEAGLVCNNILRRDPQDILALKLKENIRNYYFAPLLQGESDGEPAIQAPDAAKRELLSAPKTQLPTEFRGEPPTKPVESVEPRSNQSKAESPSSASATGARATSNIVAPRETSGLAKQSSAPVTSTPNEAPPQKLNLASQNVIAQVQAKIQAKEFDQAKSLLSQLQHNLSAQSEWQALTERLRAEETKQGFVLPWLQKAEAALVAGKYVTPPDDNVVLHCNRALAIDSQNQRALTLKKDVVGRSVAQAREWIERGRFDEARLFYSSMNYLAQNDNRFPFSQQELQRELAKMEFTSYSVTHLHRFGSCRGRLRMNGYVVSYIPVEDSPDGFSEKLKDVSVLDAGDELKLKVQDKSYRFQLNTGQGKEAAQKAGKAMYERLMRLLSPKG